MSVTIIDVANACKVSKTTVSRVFATPELVKESTRKLVYETAERLNYTPDAIARAMARKKTDNIAFIINEKQYPVISNPFYSRMLESAMAEGQRKNYSFFVAANTTIANEGDSVRNAAVRRNMDGVIMAGQADKDLIVRFLKLDIPVVLVNNSLDLPGLLCISVNNRLGSFDATEYLIKSGKKRIALIQGNFSEQVKEDRYLGYKDALLDYKIAYDAKIVCEVEPTMENAMNAAASMLSKKNRPDAIYCTNDMLAAGAIKAARKCGLRVPEDVAVMGFDDGYVSTLTEPPLTTMRIEAEEMGRVAVKTLLSLINGKEVKEKNLCFMTKLVKRESA